MSDETKSWGILKEVSPALPARFQPLMNEVRLAALDYAQQRGRWRCADATGRLEIELGRTQAHNRFIDACNALSRACGESDASQEWRRIWGDARTGEARRRIGDFACFIAYQLTLEAR